ncbi:hypothetical protein PSQ19_16275 [Devosia algicola]|uniref:Uncharacterized protein n=1 Tax=Devosia algicola TaxID=3026418 RepID=A0ABY7YLL3_9HYPH|nr:hypothetical protein [Devosia algicola]WDR02186.1 hypothetical protein PSQ19_16275 [Devosia algicola]
MDDYVMVGFGKAIRNINARNYVTGYFKGPDVGLIAPWRIKARKGIVERLTQRPTRRMPHKSNWCGMRAQGENEIYGFIPACQTGSMDHGVIDGDVFDIHHDAFQR